MKELLTNLIEFKTTADQTNELYKIVDFVNMHFNKYEVHVSRHEKNKKPSLVISTKFNRKPKIMLNGHLDVVPASDEMFKPMTAGSKMTARGTADMKGQVAAMITAFTELIEEKKDLDIALMLTTDEELGGFDGVKYLLEEEKYSAEYAFVPDQGQNWQVCTDEKGAWHLKVVGKGKSAHGSRPWLGDNAINKCWKIYMDIRDEFREKWGKLAPDDKWKPTVNLGSLHGGDAANKVPNYAEMLLDIRFPAPIKFEEIKEIVDKAASRRVSEIESRVIVQPSHIEKENIALRNWNKTVIEKKGKDIVEYIKSEGGSDGRFFLYQNIPTVMTSPNISAPHTDDEWVDLEDLEIFKNCIKDWIIKMHS